MIMDEDWRYLPWRACNAFAMDVKRFIKQWRICFATPETFQLFLATFTSLKSFQNVPPIDALKRLTETLMQCFETYLCHGNEMVCNGLRKIFIGKKCNALKRLGNALGRLGNSYDIFL